MLYNLVYCYYYFVDNIKFMINNKINMFLRRIFQLNRTNIESKLLHNSTNLINF